MPIYNSPSEARISLLAFGRLAVSIQNRAWTYRNVTNGLSLLVGKQLDAYLSFR